MRWLNDYIGIPYVVGGRDFDGVDCYGLVKLVYAMEYSETLPDWLTDQMDMREKAKSIESAVTSGEFTAVENPKDGDFVICYRAKAAHHLGLYYAGSVLHAYEGNGVVFEPVDRFRRAFPTLVFGEWKPA
jgi:cell wall-associated NlpC family hydrolase